jgi:hypothetical protein
MRLFPQADLGAYSQAAQDRFQAISAYYAGLRSRDIACLLAWTGSWTGGPDNPSAASAISAMTRVICAASTLGAQRRTSGKRQASGSNPLTGSQVSEA